MPSLIPVAIPVHDFLSNDLPADFRTIRLSRDGATLDYWRMCTALLKLTATDCDFRRHYEAGGNKFSPTIFHPTELTDSEKVVAANALTILFGSAGRFTLLNTIRKSIEPEAAALEVGN